MADDDTDEGMQGRPKIFKNVTAWIGGATAVVVALGGLAGAYHNMFPSQAAEAAADTSNDASTAETSNDAGAADNTAATSDATAEITGYSTDDGGSVRHIDGMWVWKTKDGETFRYTELTNDGTNTVAVLKGGGENGKDVYLRWPNAGGEAFQSFDDQATWTEPVNLTPETS